ncbi:MAG: ABC transporter permease [Streptosporangiaceae bacterium]
MSMLGMPPDPSRSLEAGLVPEATDMGALAPEAGAALTEAALPATRPRSTFRRGLEVFVDNKLAVAGVAIIVAVLLFCFIGPLLYYGTTSVVDFAHETLPPGAGRPLGTDANGQDVLARLMTSGQISLEVGIAAAVLATVIGVLWGSVAGYFGGVVDAVMMRIVDAALSIPVLFLLLVIVAMVAPTEPVLIGVIGLVSWLTTARLVRGEALSLRVREYVQAMKVMGGGSARAVLRHIAPNAIGTITVNLTFQVADAIAFIVALSYLGLGIRPPQEDWGAMLSYGVQYVSDGYWWLILPAGFCIVVVLAAIMWIGEGLRDAVEVRLQRR